MTRTPTVWIVQTGNASQGVAALFKQLGLFSARLFSSFHDVRVALRKETPRVILIEGFPNRTLIAGIQRLKEAAPSTRVFVLTPGDDVQALNAQISNLVLEATTEKSAPASSAKAVYGLSTREQEILRLMVRGLINKEIAEELSISYFTVDNHQRRIYEKLNVHTRTAAVTKVLLEKMV
jgi:DNA-binding NarL/FixJ family response regulator